MKVSIGMRLKRGPWGGGNQFGRALAAFLQEQGVEVHFDLTPPDLDLILLTEPRRHLSICAYDPPAIWRYLAAHPRTLVVHRVNECDERKDTRGVNRCLRLANWVADHTVFVSAWLRDLFLKQGMASPSHSVIRNGSDPAIFHPRGYRPWQGEGPLRLVTHHWSNHWNKGFDIYQRLDQLLGREPFRSRYRFTYIGNLPEGFRFQNAEYVPPLSGHELAQALRRHHVYLTASRNEPGSHHQNEGAACGLPLLYLESGSLPEYCQGFGVPFTPEDFEDRLEEMRRRYPELVTRMPRYPHQAPRMCRQYHRLFRHLLEHREDVLAARPGRRRLRWWLGRVHLAPLPRIPSRSLETD